MRSASAADAAKKAFLCNRLGDFGFLNGIMLVWAVTGTLNFADVHTQILNNPEIFDTAATGRWAADFLRGGGKIGPISAARLAAGRHGRPDAGQRPDPRRDNGGGGRLYAVPGVLHI